MGGVACIGSRVQHPSAASRRTLGAVREDDLQQLRRRVSQLLDQLQALPGFTDRRAAVGQPPDDAREWPWNAVIRATESDQWLPGTVRWRDRTAEETQSELVAGTPSAAEHAFLRKPVNEPLPPTAVRDALATYRDDVRRFADLFVLGAQWSARAVHDAIRLERSIRLPDIPASWVTPPFEEAITLDPRQPILSRSMREIAEALLTRADGQPGASDHGSSMPGERLWAGAVTATKLRLEGKVASSTHRSHLSRLRPWLNAAVTGLDQQPLHRVDAPDYPDNRRRVEKQAKEKEQRRRRRA